MGISVIGERHNTWTWPPLVAAAAVLALVAAGLCVDVAAVDAAVVDDAEVAVLAPEPLVDVAAAVVGVELLLPPQAAKSATAADDPTPTPTI